MSKIDYKKELGLYKPSATRVSEVRVPALNYLMIDGIGDPNTSPAYRDAVTALFAVSYTIKFAIKRSELAIDYGVMPLEGLWWADDMSAFTGNDRSQWRWTMMILQPKVVTAAHVRAAVANVVERKSIHTAAQLRFEKYTEGLCAQILHRGPFTDEGPTIERLHAYIAERGQLTGKHHEIYLSDIRKAAPAKWKTIIRQPMLAG